MFFTLGPLRLTHCSCVCVCALVAWRGQFEFTSRLHDATIAAQTFEAKRVLELQDALRRYVIFQSSLLANCQVCMLCAWGG